MNKVSWQEISARINMSELSNNLMGRFTPARFCGTMVCGQVESIGTLPIENSTATMVDSISGPAQRS
ncbi:hypothetical protein N9N28_04945 [Rubripirellula amarantea]|uniref:hypothetical protein n=1 Tax=Rubripirellula amarantea TaxID=2527999 RepID=UPI0013EF2358|nr:hypothetical protein [Rubripirellula amarantea]MDA8743963.1 hypothetical protein [Rubripirellula amarantea]